MIKVSYKLSLTLFERGWIVNKTKKLHFVSENGARVGHAAVTLSSGFYMISGRGDKQLKSNICKLVIR